MDKALAGKLLAFQKEVGTVSKDLENPYFKSQYFDVNKVIEIIKPILNKVGLLVSQPIGLMDGKNVLATEIYDVDTGESLRGSMYLPDNIKPQDMGIAITYFRRYSLVSMLLLQGEADDDGNKATGNVDPKFAPRKVIATPNTKTIQNPANDLPFIS